MPTERKIKSVEDMREWMENCTIAISADYTGMSLGDMTDLRREMREKGTHFRVVKNTLAHLAADTAGRPEIKGIVEGPTGVAYGYGEPSEPAKALAQFIRANKSPLRIKGGVMGNQTLTALQVHTLATLPSKEVIIARLAGQLQGPISALAYVLNAPVSGLARVLKAQSEKVAG